MNKKVALNPKEDVVFKRIFGIHGNEDLLEDLLSSILNQKIKCKEIIREARIGQLDVDEKYGSLDLKAVLEDGREVDVDIQLKFDKNLPLRMHAYASMLTSESLKKAVDYKELTQKIIIFITDHVVFKQFDEAYQETVLVLKNHKDYEFSDHHKYIIVQLPKYKESKEIKNKLDRWVAFLNQNEEVLDKMVVADKVIEKAQRELDYLSGDEELKRIVELKHKWVLDYNSGVSNAREEGRAEEKKKMIIAMLKNGFKVSAIAKVSNLSVDEIKKIKEDLKY